MKFDALSDDMRTIGQIDVAITEDGDAPFAVRDQHGTTWVRCADAIAVRGVARFFYVRTACADATLVKP